MLTSQNGILNRAAEAKEKTEGTDDVTLNSASGEAFNLTEWKVLSIENGKVELVPAKPTEGTVYLGQAQGYNNGVKLLNDACSSLYGNTSKNYWLASRCVDTYSSNCGFGMRCVGSGSVGAYDMCNSSNGTINNSLALFPVVSLGFSLLSGNATSGYTVK